MWQLQNINIYKNEIKAGLVRLKERLIYGVEIKRVMYPKLT